MIEKIAEQKKEEETSLQFAIALSLFSYLISFIAVVHLKYGISTLPIIVGYPDVLREFMAEAFGGSVFLPALHVSIASIFKSKRNPNTRRKIFINWAIGIMILNALTFLLEKPNI